MCSGGDASQIDRCNDRIGNLLEPPHKQCSMWMWLLPHPHNASDPFYFCNPTSLLSSVKVAACNNESSSSLVCWLEVCYWSRWASLNLQCQTHFMGFWLWLTWLMDEQRMDWNMPDLLDTGWICTSLLSQGEEAGIAFKNSSHLLFSILSSVVIILKHAQLKRLYFQFWLSFS